MRNQGFVPAMVLATAAAASLSAGCATTLQDFRMDAVAADEAAIAGRVTVIYNGQVYTENCQVVFGKTVYKLDPSGMVLLREKRGMTKLAGVVCLDKSLYHYDFQGSVFDAEGSGAVTYFGDVTINWRTDGGLKVSAFFGAIGAAIDAGSNDGQARLTVADMPDRVRAAFANAVGPTRPWVTHLVTRGTGLATAAAR